MSLLADKIYPTCKLEVFIKIYFRKCICNSLTTVDYACCSNDTQKVVTFTQKLYEMRLNSYYVRLAPQSLRAAVEEQHDVE